MYNLVQIRKDLEDFNAGISLAYYNHAAYGHKLRISKIYEKYRHLSADKNIIKFIKPKMDGTKDESVKRGLHYLYFTLVDMYINRKLSKLAEKLSKLDLGVVKVDNQEIPFRNISSLLANEENREKRKKLYRSADETTKKMNMIMLQLDKKRKALFKEFGFKNGIEFYEKSHMFDFGKLDSDTTKILNETESIYKELKLELANETLGLPLNELRFYDEPIINRAKRFDKFFPEEKMMNTAKDTLLGVGMDLSKQNNISIDCKKRPEKVNGAFAYLISVPEDIRVLVKPVGGLMDYESLLHELGHAEQFASVDRRLPVEFKLFGSCAITEAFAFVFSYPMFDKTWLKKYTKMEGETVGKYLKCTLYIKLNQIRWACAAIKFDLAKYGSRKNLKSYFAELYEKVFFIKPDCSEKLRYLFQSYGFYSINHLYGWVLDTQIREYLRKKYGEMWFENKDSGKCLKHIWKTGLKSTIEELSRVAGFDGPDPHYLISELEHIYAESKGL